jgi:hypothetical protein
MQQKQLDKKIIEKTPSPIVYFNEATITLCCLIQYREARFYIYCFNPASLFLASSISAIPASAFLFNPGKPGL